MSVQCRMCEAGEYKSLEELQNHLKIQHKLTRDDLIQYGGDFSYDIELLIYARARIPSPRNQRTTGELKECPKRF